MRVLILTQYFAPEPVEKIVDLARRLRRQGHDVQVLTGFPCYPHGKIYPGHHQAFVREEMFEGIRLIRVPQLPDHSRSVLRRIQYYLSFALSAATIGLLRVRKADVMLVYQSALPVGLAAWVISRLRRMPYVLDVVDLWPESVAASGMVTNRFALSILQRVAKFIYRGAASVNVITEGYRENLLTLGVPAHKLRLIHCWHPGSEAAPPIADEDFVRREGMEGKFNVVYSGAIGPCQQLQTVVEAAELLRADPRVQFNIAGDGIEREALQRHVISAGLSNVRLCGWRSAADAAKLQAVADMLVVHLKPDAMSRISIPSKTFAYMAAGKPLLMAVEGEAAALVRRHQCGFAIPPSDPHQMAAAIRQCMAMPQCERHAVGRAARQAFEEYSPRQQVAKVVESLQAAIVRSQNRIPSVSPLRPTARMTIYQRHGKRLLDIAIASPLFILSAPLLAILLIAVRVKLGAPALFKQVRPGLHEQPFELLKLRSMNDARDANGELLPDGERLTRFGRFLRATSLDELPELWNVLRGHMSLVGPRPLLSEYLPLYSQKQARRHLVRPGMTGWAQVNGRNDISWEGKLELDAWYADHVSLALDLRIIWRTFFSVMWRNGVSKPGFATTDKFTGSKDSRGTGFSPVVNAADSAKNAIVLGAGGHAKVVISTLLAAGWTVKAAYDDDPAKWGTILLGIEVQGPLASLSSDDTRAAVIAIGAADARQAVADRFRFRWISVVHPAAWVDPSVSLGEGTVVSAGAIVQPDCRIGRHAIINTSSSIDHDCCVGDFAHIGPGVRLTGNVRIGPGTLIGAGTEVLPGATIGANARIGAGSVVKGTIRDGVTAVGRPASPINHILPQERAA